MTRAKALDAVELEAVEAAPVEKGGVSETGARESGWTFLTNYAHVLICLAREPDLRLRDVALRVGVTERAVQRIVADMEAAGVLKRSRDGRRNRYEVDTSRPLRHELEAHRTVADLLKLVEAGD